VTATLLMPKEFLEGDLQNEEYVDLLDDDFLQGLARKYGVSAQALVNRLKNLGYIPE
jgi:Zn-dependent peptidase ImmA (M78 family)